jgi:RNA-directed DNA polymerase
VNYLSSEELAAILAQPDLATDCGRRDAVMLSLLDDTGALVQELVDLSVRDVRLDSQQWRGRHARGDVIIVRYADDFVMGFQHREEAERFLRELTERMGKFGLSLHPEKTRLIEFGRFAAANRKQRGQGKPDTFDFLGFTHICTTTRKGKSFTIKRKIMAKRFCRKLKEVKQTLLRRRHVAIPELGKWLRSVVRGFMNYHAVPGNFASIKVFPTQVARH